MKEKCVLFIMKGFIDVNSNKWSNMIGDTFINSTQIDYLASSLMLFVLVSRDTTHLSCISPNLYNSTISFHTPQNLKPKQSRPCSLLLQKY